MMVDRLRRLRVTMATETGLAMEMTVELLAPRAQHRQTRPERPQKRQAVKWSHAVMGRVAAKRLALSSPLLAQCLVANSWKANHGSNKPCSVAALSL